MARRPPLGRHPLEFSHVMAEKNHPEKGKRPAKKARPGPGPRPKTRATEHTPRAQGTHELPLQPLPHSKHHFKAANRWRILCKPAEGFQGARQSSPVVRRCGVRPDYCGRVLTKSTRLKSRGFDLNDSFPKSRARMAIVDIFAAEYKGKKLRAGRSCGTYIF